MQRGWMPALAAATLAWGGADEAVVTRRFLPPTIHVSADERFELFLDGRRITRGPNRSTVDFWSYKTYEIRLAPGAHRMEALCWSLGPLSPMAQLTWRGGFVLKADGPYDAKLTTGKGPWRAAWLEGLRLDPPKVGAIFGVGGELTARGAGPQWKEGAWTDVVVVRGPVRDQPYGIWKAGWRLHPSTLPDMLDRRVGPGRIVAVVRHTRPDEPFGEGGDPAEIAQWQAVVDGRGEVTVPTGEERTVLWDLGDYYCAHPYAEISGADDARLEWAWAESLYLPGGRAKGHRDEFRARSS